MSNPSYRDLYDAVDTGRREVLAEVKALGADVRTWQARHEVEHDRTRWRAWRAAGAVAVLVVAVASVVLAVLIRGGGA